MKSKKGKLQKCPVCHHQFKKENLDKHMHSRSHHEAVERLKGRQETHMCWACGMYVPGLKEYEKHIATLTHIKNMGLLQKKRGNGFKVDYIDEELTAICAKRDQKQALRLEKKKKKLKRKKWRKALWSKEQLNRNLQREKIQMNKNTTVRSEHPSSIQCLAPAHDVPFHSNKEPEVSEPGLEASMLKSEQVVDQRNFYWQHPRFRNLKGDVDFTSDLPSPSQGLFFYFQEEDRNRSQQSSSGICRQKSKAAFQKKSQKRLLDADLSDSPHVKRLYLSGLSSVNLKPEMYGRYASFTKGAGSERVCQGTSLDINTQSLHATGLIHGQVDPCGSLMGNSVEIDQSLFIHSEKRFQNPGKQQAMNKRRLSLLMKPSCRTSPAASGSNVLKENQADQKEEEEPAHSQRNLTTLLNRSVSKTEASKLNLNMARRVRASQRPTEGEPDSRLLKPAVQKLISSKDWRKINQEAPVRKLQRDRDMPRSGIEFVSQSAPESLELVLEGVEDFAEGFQWKSMNPGDVASSFLREKTFFAQPAEAPPRPSGEKHDGDASNLPPMKSEMTETATRRNDDASGRHRNSHAKVPMEVERKDAYTANPASETQHGKRPEASLVHGSLEKLGDFGTQQLQSNEEHIQQKTKGDSNKNIQNVDISKRKASELLAVYQREDELNICLEDVNNELLQHNAALQAAFWNVQYLLEVKQQFTAQMSSLRAERIAILRRMQNSRPSSADFPKPPTESQQLGPGTSRQQRD